MKFASNFTTRACLLSKRRLTSGINLFFIFFLSVILELGFIAISCLELQNTVATCVFLLLLVPLFAIV